MTYLHSLDILHGDLTGGNILLVSSNKDARMFIAKVADFGLSRVLSAEAISTGTYGTVTHMPPELLTTGVCQYPLLGLFQGCTVYWMNVCNPIWMQPLCHAVVCVKPSIVSQRSMRQECT